MRCRFSIAGFYLPQILADQGIRDGRDLSETYRECVLLPRTPGLPAADSRGYSYIAIYAPGIAGSLLLPLSSGIACSLHALSTACLLGACLIEIPRVGRQWSMVVSSALMAVSFFLYTIVTTQAGSVGLNALEYFMQSVRCPPACYSLEPTADACVLLLRRSCSTAFSTRSCPRHIPRACEAQRRASPRRLDALQASWRL